MSLHWKDVVFENWGDFYEVNPNGQVRNKRNGFVLKPTKGSNGYPIVTLKAKPYKCCVSVHALILKTFGGIQPTPKHECCHIDGTRDNNDISNLRWGTRKENFEDKILHGRSKRKFTDAQIVKIRELSKNGMNDHAISKEYNVASWTITQIIRRTTYFV